MSILNEEAGGLVACRPFLYYRGRIAAGFPVFQSMLSGNRS
ncbi:MAG: hypothetical protein WEB58_14985 [Planctomycetaceae bacterium]